MSYSWGYTRVSTLRQAEQGVSLDAQERIITDYVKHRLEPKGLPLAAIFRDSAQSGIKPMVSRPGGKELQMRLRQGDAVVISRLDRGFRSLKDLLNTFDLWKSKGVSLHLLDLNIDTETPMGLLLLSVIGAVAEFEKTVRTERVRCTVSELRSQGYFVGPGPKRYGWKSVGPKCKRKLIPDLDQRAFGCRLLEWSRQGWSWVQIYLHLQQIGLQYNGKIPSPNTIGNWLHAERALQQMEYDQANGQQANGKTPQKK